jgi:general secretion pathway protein G
MLKKFARFKKLVKNQKGMTLIELIVVITILGILAGGIVLGTGILQQPEKAKRVAAQQAIKTFELTLDVYAADHGSYPTTEEGLQALLQPPDDATSTEDWKPYIKPTDFKDPWGNEYIYRSPVDRLGYEYEILSMGKDEKEGTEDDVVSWIEEIEE